MAGTMEGLSRRNFLKAALASSAALAAGTALVGCGSGKNDALMGIPDKWDYETDVLCLGGGATGVAAALWAKYSGAESLILEKGETSLACSAALSDGQIAAGGTKFQEEMGVEDSAEKYYQWVEEIQPLQKVCPSDLECAKVICDGSTELVNWWLDLGCEVKGELQAFVGMKEKRWHTFMMQDVMNILLAEVEAQGIDLMTSTEATRLIVNAEGRVIGAEAKKGSEVIYCKARKGVVLGTGGYSASPEMLEMFNGPQFAKTKPVGCKTNTGDGYRMALSLGAQLRDVYVDPSMALSTSEPLIGIVQWPRAGGVLINDKGVRYTAENVGARDEAIATGQQEGKCYIIMDERFKGFEHAMITYDRYIQLGGKEFKADTYEALAEQIGVDPKTLADTMKKYNGYCKAGKDPDFGRNTIDELEGSAPAPALDKAPFYAYEVCAAIYPIQMRLNTDTACRVRDQYGEPIPGLYAGGLMGNIGIRNPDSGQMVPALGGAFVQGMIAGKDAAAQESWEA